MALWGPSPSPAWTVTELAPDHCLGTWTAVASVTQRGTVIFDASQEVFAGDPTVLQVLADTLPLVEMVRIVEDLIRSGFMRPDSSDSYVLASQPNCVVVADTAGAVGRVRFSAWCCEPPCACH